VALERAEDRGLTVASIEPAGLCRREVGVQVLLGRVVGGDLVALAIFLVEAKPPPLMLRVVTSKFIASAALARAKL
jgi:hypothetical protein